MDENTKQQIIEAVTEAFSAGIKDGRYIDVSRVPLICQSIVQIGKDISDLKTVQADLVTQDQFWPVKTLVYGVVALMLTAVIGAILVLVLR